MRSVAAEMASRKNTPRELQIFPIDTATSCQYKWTWSTLFLSSGRSSSCHRCQTWDVKDDIKNFHNHPGKIGDREKMLEGEWPGNGCEYCKKIEDAGGESERSSYINKELMSPPELEYNPTATKVTPRILEVYFANVCNQKCVYCSPIFSNLIQKEIEKFGPIVDDEYDLKGYEVVPEYRRMKREFWEWMDDNAIHLYNFQVLGGEPLYQKEIFECLEFFEARELPQLNWKIFSNLKHNFKGFKQKVDRISALVERGAIRSFEMVCSIDNWGPQAEFARSGMKLDEWKRNFEYVLHNPYITLSIHSTISPVTISTMPEFYKMVMEYSKVKKIDYGWNTVKMPSFMNPEILGHYTEKFYDELLDVVEATDYRKRYLEGFKKQCVSHPVDVPRLTKLRNYLDGIDKRRGTDWKSLYPWMVEAMDKEGAI